MHALLGAIVLCIICIAVLKAIASGATFAERITDLMDEGDYIRAYFYGFVILFACGALIGLCMQYVQGV